MSKGKKWMAVNRYGSWLMLKPGSKAAAEKEAREFRFIVGEPANVIEVAANAKEPKCNG